jgi:hypothetical protein
LAVLLDVARQPPEPAEAVQRRHDCPYSARRATASSCATSAAMSSVCRALC